LDVFIVRKEPKKHGTQRAIEGSLERGARVVVVDDVITTGGATVKAIETVLAAGFVVVKAVILVDRQEKNGRENIEKFCPVDSIFTRADLLEFRKNNDS
jgi:orotate phosphoribosyltransferase